MAAAYKDHAEKILYLAWRSQPRSQSVICRGKGRGIFPLDSAMKKLGARDTHADARLDEAGGSHDASVN